MNPNHISFWLPRVLESGVKTPKTYMIGIPCPIVNACTHDGGACPGLDDLIEHVQWGCNKLGYPCFLRFGEGSGKHDWADCCYVRSKEEVQARVLATAYDQVCKDLSYDMVVVREWIHTMPLFRAFGDFPVTREFRLFVKGIETKEQGVVIRERIVDPDNDPDADDREEDGPVLMPFTMLGPDRLTQSEVYHIQPYWPATAIERHTKADGWQETLLSASTLTESEFATLKNRAHKVMLEFEFTGYYDWSMDFLQDVNGEWWLTDMAVGVASYRWDPEFQVVIP